MKTILLASLLLLSACGGQPIPAATVHRTFLVLARAACAYIATMPDPPAEVSGGETP